MRLMTWRAIFGGPYSAEAFEHQRYLPMKGWSERHLMPTERKRWSKRDGHASATDMDEFCYRAALLLPEGWRWDAAWWGGASWNPC